MSDTRPFHETKTLAEMTPEEWESLCDGCGKCCVMLLEDDGDGTVWETRLACRLLDLKTMRCTDYPNHSRRVPGCLTLTPELVPELNWMPDSCAYRLIAAGKPLPDWHPLKTGDPDSTRKAGMSLHRKLISEDDVPEDEVDRFVVGRR